MKTVSDLSVLKCPACGSTHVVKDGSIYRCMSCDSFLFIDEHDEVIRIVDEASLERISLRISQYEDHKADMKEARKIAVMYDSLPVHKKFGLKLSAFFEEAFLLYPFRSICAIIIIIAIICVVVLLVGDS